jgi:hypothetical protein
MKTVQQINWFILALFAMVCFVGIALIIKRLTLTEPQSEIINFYFFLLTTVVFLVFSLLRVTRTAKRSVEMCSPMSSPIVAVAGSHQWPRDRRAKYEISLWNVIWWAF